MGLSGGQNGKKRCGVTELPDCILESIVSLLPLKDAVETSLVCPQWRHLSRPILKRRNLELDSLNVLGIRYPDNHDMKKMRRDFVRRVNKYMQQYEGNKVDSFKLLHCILLPESHATLDEWIRFAITKGVEQVDLRLSFCSNPQDYYLFPHRLLLEQLSAAGSPLNLKYLSLENCTLTPPLDFDGFNQLTTLHLNRVMVDPSLMANLFSVCLLLESLTLNWCQMKRPSHHLNLNFVAGDRLTDLKVLHCDEGTKLEISAPNLASLEYIPYCYSRSVSINTPRLARVYISDTRVYDTFLPKALVQFALCPGLETLHLQMPGETPRISSLPTFGNLKQLKLDIDIFLRGKVDLDHGCVLDLLKAAPVLEELVIMVSGIDLSEQTNDQREIVRNPSGQFTHDHLKTVKMQGFVGNWYETELAICILENTPKLEMLVIDPSAKTYWGNGYFEFIISDKNYSEKCRAVIQEKLKDVKSDAQIIFL